jgi:tRNA A37 threonylcarbamoyladenosine synthetase subunit TsaC/SUA5/YrdC
VLDKESFTLEELLEEDDVIQECKSLNSRLINLCVPGRATQIAPASRHARTEKTQKNRRRVPSPPITNNLRRRLAHPRKSTRPSLPLDATVENFPRHPIRARTNPVH